MTISFVNDQITPVTMSFIKQVVKNWNKIQGKKSVELTFIDHEEMRVFLESYLTSSTPPDVLTWFAGNRMQSYMERELMMRTASIKGIQGFYNSLQPRFQKMLDVGDARFFIPTSYFWWGVYYRPSVFKKVGINTPINSWDDLTVAVDKLLDHDIVPFSLGSQHRCPAAAWFDYLNMRINGPEFHQDLMDLKIPYTDTRIKKVLSFFRDLQDKDWFLGKANSYDEEEAVEAIFNGKVGMTFIGSYIQDECVSPEQINDLDFFRFPVIDEALGVGEDTPIDGFFASGNSNKLQEAGEFLLHLGSQSVQQLATNSITSLPTRSDIDFQNIRPELAKGHEMIEESDKLFQFFDLDTPWEIADVGMSRINEFVSREIDESSLQSSIEKARVSFLNQTNKIESII